MNVREFDLNIEKVLENFGLLRYFGNAIVAGGDCAEMKPEE